MHALTVVALLAAAAQMLAAAPACCASIRNSSNTAVPASCGGSRPVGLPFARRSPVLSQRGQVASAHPLASQAGLDILKAGGNAIDAAIATNAVLAVLEPMMCGPGGDLAALVWIEKDSALYGYIGSGRSSASKTIDDLAEELRQINQTYIPELGPLSVTIPGAPAGWCDLSTRFGKLPLATVLAPAIAYANIGAPVPQIISHEWSVPPNNSDMTSGGRYPHAIDGWLATFTVPNGPDGARRAPAPGEIFRNPALGATLMAIAEGGCDAFYRGGEVTSNILQFAAANGIKMTGDDLANHSGTWVDPISTTYRARYTMYQLPPNHQGVATLELLNLLEGFNLTAMGHNSADYLSAHIESKKLAFADASFFVADPTFSSIPLTGLINKGYASERRNLINLTAAAQTDSHGSPQPDLRYHSDTTYLTVADEEGNMVSWIQSLYSGFGSGLVDPRLGFAFQSRGALFSMDRNAANAFAPRKRPYHTIMPSFVMRDGKPFMSFGVMGGFMQPQGCAQVLCNIVDFGMNVVEAGEAARYEHEYSSQPTGQVMTDGGSVQLEAGVCDETVAELQRRGHTITRGANGGGYQAIMRTPVVDGASSGWIYEGASEMRKDGLVAAY